VLLHRSGAIATTVESPLAGDNNVGGADGGFTSVWNFLYVEYELESTVLIDFTCQ